MLLLLFPLAPKREPSSDIYRSFLKYHIALIYLAQDLPKDPGTIMGVSEN